MLLFVFEKVFQDRNSAGRRNIGNGNLSPVYVYGAKFARVVNLDDMVTGTFRSIIKSSASS